MSAYGDMANIRTAMNRGAFDFVTKPIDFGDLETTITKTIRAHRCLARRTRTPGRGGAGPCLAVALLLAQSGAAARQRGGTAELAGQRREIATLFTDIAGFTALVETLEPSVSAGCSTSISRA